MKLYESGEEPAKDYAYKPQKTLNFEDDIVIAQDKENPKFMSSRLFKKYDSKVRDGEYLATCSEYIYLDIEIEKKVVEREERESKRERSGVGSNKEKPAIGCLKSVLWSKDISKENAFPTQLTFSKHSSA